MRNSCTNQGSVPTPFLLYPERHKETLIQDLQYLLSSSRNHSFFLLWLPVQNWRRLIRSRFAKTWKNIFLPPSLSIPPSRFACLLSSPSIFFCSTAAFGRLFTFKQHDFFFHLIFCQENQPLFLPQTFSYAHFAEMFAQFTQHSQAQNPFTWRKYT